MRPKLQNRLLLSLGLLPLVMSAAMAQDRLPHFKDYAVSEVYKGANAPVVLKRDDRTFRTRLREASKEKPNFAGHYILTAGWLSSQAPETRSKVT